MNDNGGTAQVGAEETVANDLAIGGNGTIMLTIKNGVAAALYLYWCAIWSTHATPRNRGDLPLSRHTLTPPDPEKWRRNQTELERTLGEEIEAYAEKLQALCNLMPVSFYANKLPRAVPFTQKKTTLFPNHEQRC